MNVEFDLTPERLGYLAARGKLVLNACPGSGKTSSVAYKLTELVKDWKENGSGIACLSFTNSAKNEIKDRFRKISGFPLTYPHFNGTIDSFINRNITLPYIRKIAGITGKIIITDDATLIKDLFKYDLPEITMDISIDFLPPKLSCLKATRCYGITMINLRTVDSLLMLGQQKHTSSTKVF